MINKSSVRHCYRRDKYVFAYALRPILHLRLRTRSTLNVRAFSPNFHRRARSRLKIAKKVPHRRDAVLFAFQLRRRYRESQSAHVCLPRLDDGSRWGAVDAASGKVMGWGRNNGDVCDGYFMRSWRFIPGALGYFLVMPRYEAMPLILSKKIR